jgi:hypothetical protein
LLDSKKEKEEKRKRMHVRGNKDLSRKIMLGMLNEKVSHGSKPFQPEREREDYISTSI